MEHRTMRFGNKKLHPFFAVIFLAVFLISGISAEWTQADTFISHMENMQSFSEGADVLSISEGADVLSISVPGQEILGDVCISEPPMLRIENVSTKREGASRDAQRGFLIFLCILAQLLSGICLICGVEWMGLSRTHSQKIILSYMQKQDGKKNHFISFFR